MTALLGFILSNPTVIAIIGGIAAALGWGWKQRHAGAAKERAKQADRDLKAQGERLEMNREATDQERKAAALSDEEAMRRALEYARKNRD